MAVLLSLDTCDSMDDGAIEREIGGLREKRRIPKLYHAKS